MQAGRKENHSTEHRCQDHRYACINNVLRGLQRFNVGSNLGKLLIVKRRVLRQGVRETLAADFMAGRKSFLPDFELVQLFQNMALKPISIVARR